MINQVNTPSYVYTISRPVSMVEWYENEFHARADVREYSIKLNTFSLPMAYELLKFFGAFRPQWVA